MAKGIFNKIGSTVKKLGNTIKDAAKDKGGETFTENVKNTFDSVDRTLGGASKKFEAGAKNARKKINNIKNEFKNNSRPIEKTFNFGGTTFSTGRGVFNDVIDTTIGDTRKAATYGKNFWDVAKHGVGENHVGQLIRRTDDNLFGYKPTLLGHSLIAGAFVVSGLPQAKDKFNEIRQGEHAGVYQMGQINMAGLTPQGHAYADNAGATGDLALALSNNR